MVYVGQSKLKYNVSIWAAVKSVLTRNELQMKESRSLLMRVREVEKCPNLKGV
jgi:hypothetical protein